jgi:hypothetical protein
LSALVNVNTIVSLEFVSNGALFAGKRPLIVHAVRVIVAVVEPFFTLVDISAFFTVTFKPRVAGALMRAHPVLTAGVFIARIRTLSALVNVYTIVPVEFVSSGARFAGKRPLIVHAVRVIVAVV